MVPLLHVWQISESVKELNDKTSSALSLTHGVPQGSILGPTLFLVMIADMPRFVIGDMTNPKMTGYVDDSTVYANNKNVNLLKTFYCAKSKWAPV